MSTREDYTVEEWDAIRRTPAESVIAIEQASPSGLWGRRKERKAAERGFATAIANVSGLGLVDALVAARNEEGALLDALRAGGESFTASAPETAKRARRAIEAKGSPGELEAFAAAVLDTCEGVAMASAEGGDVERTSKAEALVLTRIAAALGIGGYEPPSAGWVGMRNVQMLMPKFNRKP